MRRLLLSPVAPGALVAPVLREVVPVQAAVAGRTPRILLCTNRAVRRPASFTITSADGSTRWTKAKWQTWGETAASAKGVVWQNDCTPTCVAGHAHHVPATIELSGAVASMHHGRLFSLAVIRWTAKGRHHHGRFLLAT